MTGAPATSLYQFLYGAQPNWIIAALISAALSMVLTEFRGALVYPVRRFRRDPIERRWFEYHLSFLEGRVVLCKGGLEIKKGVRSQYVVRCHNCPSVSSEGMPARETLYYKGTATYELNHVVIRLLGRNYTVSVALRFINRIPSNDAVIPGIWSAYDHDGTPASGACLLTREALTDQKAIELLKAWIDTKYGAIRVALREDGETVHRHKRPRASSGAQRSQALQGENSPQTGE